ncbi:MAG: hypothetical protein JO025_13480 [Verrucomicrobia bacterium]|nr:hypothetical protein [Verrucomicrobiota bacterium]
MSRLSLAGHEFTKPRLVQKRFGIEEADPLCLIKKNLESCMLLFVSSPSLFLPISRSSSRYGIQALQFKLWLLELDQVFETNIERLADGSADGGIQLLRWPWGGEAVQALFVHRKATLL